MVMLNVIMLNVIVLNDIMLSVVILNVEAPLTRHVEVQKASWAHFVLAKSKKLVKNLDKALSKIPWVKANSF